MPALRDAVVVATARTPMGRYGGQLKDIRPDDLAAVVLKEVCERAGVKPAEVADVILGCANQAGEDHDAHCLVSLGLLDCVAKLLTR